MTEILKENYFDQWERRGQGRFLNDPRDFTPVEREITSNLVVFDAEGLGSILGVDYVNQMIAQSTILQPGQEIDLAA